MVAGIAHLRGYDLDDPRVRNAILACLLGEDAVEAMVKKRKLPGAADGAGDRTGARPRARPGDLRRGRLRADHPGRRQAAGHAPIGRRVPVVGGVVGLGADGFATWRIGRYADRELLPRARR